MLSSASNSNIPSGEAVDFATYGDVHLPAVLIKTFLRELQEPLLTFDLYDEVLGLAGGLMTLFHSLIPSDVPKDARYLGAQACFYKLPERNLALLAHLLAFVADVVEQNEVNKYVALMRWFTYTLSRMTNSNMAIVFGPNMLWSKDQAASLQGSHPSFYCCCD